MTFWDFFWLMLWGYIWVAFLVIIFQVITDIFRDDTINGWVRAVWIGAMIVAPPLTCLVYLIVQGKGMSERSYQAAAGVRARNEDYVRSVAGGSSPVESISKAKGLLDSGAITQAEFDVLKAKALG